MKLKLKNVGKILEADIEFNGITVIAGENNTGKSTVGKMLYCIFNSFYKMEKQINDERQKTIVRALVNYYRETYNRYTVRFSPEKIAKQIIENIEEYASDIKLLEKELEELFAVIDRKESKSNNQESLHELTKKIYSFLNITDDDIRKTLLKKRLEAEFGMKVGHLNNLEEKAKTKLKVQDREIAFEIIKNQEINIKECMSLIKEIIYIDDPFILDDLSFGEKATFRLFASYGHRDDLLEKITSNRQKTEFGVIDELFAEKRLKSIFDTMSEVCDGDLVSDDNGNYTYRTDKLDGELDIVNLSTGLKSFVILRTLLQNGKIDENGVIILDEPEIHLHPEWQLKFAEIIVLIQKEFRTNILLNTHSPYFLNAIEVYSEKYGIANKCNYYMTEETDGRTIIKNVTDEREPIYAKLARPLQDLEKMECRNGDTV